MSEADARRGSDGPDRGGALRPGSPLALWVRLGIGLAQGVALYLIVERGRIEAGPFWRVGLFFVALMAPLPALAGLTILRRGAYLSGLASASAGLFALGAYAHYSAAGHTDFLFAAPLSAITLFILYHLFLVGTAHRRFIGPYHDYFDRAWTSGVQLALALGFSAAAWMVIALGATLFTFIGLDGLEKLIRTPSFGLIFSAGVFALGVHFADRRPDIIRSVRLVALSLLGWLTPPASVMMAIFLMTLPFRGLARLRDAAPGAGLLMSAAVMLIVLANCLFQDGWPREDERIDRPRGFWSHDGVLLGSFWRLSGLLITPLTGLAAYGVIERVIAYGLTAPRIVALAGLVILASYAVFYLRAALGLREARRPWALGNIVSAYVAVAVILILLSPLADPLRWAVASQTRRLIVGRATAEEFDVNFFADDGRSGRWGRPALARLARLTGDARRVAIAARARALLDEPTGATGKPGAHAKPLTVSERQARVPLYGDGPPIAAGAYRVTYQSDDVIDRCGTAPSGPDHCGFRWIKLGSEATADLVLRDSYGRLLVLAPDGAPDRPWRVIAQSDESVAVTDWAEGRYEFAPRTFRSLRLGRGSDVNFRAIGP